MVKQTGRAMVAQNKKARHDYHIHDTYEAGLVLVGCSRPKATQRVPLPGAGPLPN